VLKGLRFIRLHAIAPTYSLNSPQREKETERRKQAKNGVDMRHAIIQTAL